MAINAEHTYHGVEEHLKYLLSLPMRYDPNADEQWPLILFLHGAGERGSDLGLVRQYGIPRAAEEQADFPFVGLSPQCPAGSSWVAELNVVTALLDDVLARHAIDTRRIYLTGLSMGGYGTWHLAAEYPERFAALAPVCGGGGWLLGAARRLCALKTVPVWAFHGALDDIVPLSESERVVNMFQACGGHARLTVYPDRTHDCWTPTYSNPELYRWLLRHKRRLA